MSTAGGTISQQAAVHPWLAADTHGNKTKKNCIVKHVNEEMIEGREGEK
jgi:hypothetical protein